MAWTQVSAVPLSVLADSVDSAPAAAVEEAPGDSVDNAQGASPELATVSEDSVDVSNAQVDGVFEDEGMPGAAAGESSDPVPVADSDSQDDSNLVPAAEEPAVESAGVDGTSGDALPADVSAPVTDVADAASPADPATPVAGDEGDAADPAASTPAADPADVVAGGDATTLATPADAAALAPATAPAAEEPAAPATPADPADPAAATPATSDAAGSAAPAAQSAASQADPASNPEQATTYPAFTGYACAGNVTVKVTAAEGVLPEGTQVQATPVYRADVVAAVTDAVEGQGRMLEGAVAVDVTLLDRDGNVIQPGASVNVSFFNAGMDEGMQVGVYHVADDASSVEAVPATVATANVQSFDVEHFSIYVVTDESPVYLATYRFLAADGTTVVSTQAVKNGEMLVEPAAPEILGATFVGWYLNDAKLDFDAPVTVTQTTTVDVQARYENILHINFYNPDGTQLVRAMVVDDNELHDISGVAYDVDATHRLMGWADATGTQLTKVAVPEGADHVDVYAVVAAGVWVSFDAAGGTAVNRVFVPAGEGIALPESVRTGYTLEGWYDGDTRVTDGTLVTEGKNLVAHWTPVKVTYTVNYWQQRVTDDKDAADADKTYDFKESAQGTALSGTTVTVGSSKTYPGFTYNATNSQTNVEVAGDGSTIVNVYYDRVLCTVKYYRVSEWSGAKFIQSFSGLYGAPLKDGEWSDTYFWYASYKWSDKDGYTTSDSGCVLLTNYDFASAGYADNKGNVTSDGVVTVCNFYGNTTTSLGALYYYNEQADGSYKLTDAVKIGGGTLTVREKYAGYDLYKWTKDVGEGDDPTQASFWEDKADVKDGDQTETKEKPVYIANALKSYKLVYRNVNSEAKSESVKYTASLAQYAGYVPDNPYTDGIKRTFVGWYADEACTVPFDFAGSTMPHANVTVFAKWSVDQVTLSWDLNAPENPQAKDRGSASFAPGTRPALDFLPTDAARCADYTFNGWYTDDGKLFSPGTCITRDTAVTGRWLYNGTFGMTYMNGDAEVALDDRSYADGSKVLVASGAGLTPPSADAPNFYGWLAEDGTLLQPGSSLDMTYELAGDDGKVVLTAAWGSFDTATTLTYKAGAGTGEDASNRLMNNAGVTLPKAEDLGFTAPTGYVFAGWKMPDGRVLQAGQQIVVDDVNAGAENVLTAQWSPRSDLSYTVNYVWIGSTDKVATSKTVTNVTYGVQVAESPVTVAGYTPAVAEAVEFDVTEDGMSVDIVYYKNVTLTANSASLVYDGSEQGVSGFTCDTEGAQFDDSGIAAGATGTDVDSYPATFSESPVGCIDGTERYIVAAAYDGTLTITPRSVVFKGETKTVEYNGAEQEITGVTAQGQGLAEGQTFKLAYSAKGTLPNTDPGYPGAFAGQATIWAGDADVTANYAVEYAPGTLFVTTSAVAGNIDITPADVVEKYDGASHAAGTAVATDKNGNAVTVEYSADGQAWTGDPADVTATAVADSTTVRVRASVPGVYEGYAYGEELLTVVPRDVSLTSGSAAKVYDGLPLTNADVAVAGDGWAEGEGATYDVTGTQTDAGRSDNAFTYALDEGTDAGNYNVTTYLGSLEVTPADAAAYATLTPADVEKAYDGLPLAAGEAQVGIAEGADASGLPEDFLDQFVVEYSADGTAWTADPADITATDVADSLSGDAAVLVRASSTSGNVAGTLTATENVLVTPRPIEVTAGSATKAYDGLPLTCDAWSVTSEEGFVHLEGAEPEGFASVTLEGSQTLVGTSGNEVAGYEFLANTKAGNYFVALARGTLAVTDGTGRGGDPVDPGKVVVKTHEAGTYALGQTVEFTITATNIYDVPKTMTFAEQEGVELTGQAVFENVEPGATVSTTARYTVTEADLAAGGFTNTATVAFQDGPTFPAIDKVEVGEPTAHLTVSKAATSTPAEGGAYRLGETVSYEVTVTNDGNLTVNDVVVTDELKGAVLAEGESAEVGTLAPGETATLHYSYTVTEADVLAGKVVNTATATGTTDGPDTPDASVTPGTSENPTVPAERVLDVVKTITSQPADGMAYQAGETVQFEVVVRNAGNQTLTNIQVTDEMPGTVLAEGEKDLIESLAPGETATLHYSYTVTEADLGTSFRNVASALAEDGTEGDGETPEIPVAPKPTPEPAPQPDPDTGVLPVGPDRTTEPESGQPEQPARAIAKTADETPVALTAGLAGIGAAALMAGTALFVANRRRG